MEVVLAAGALARQIAVGGGPALGECGDQGVQFPVAGGNGLQLVEVVALGLLEQKEVLRPPGPGQGLDQGVGVAAVVAQLGQDRGPALAMEDRGDDGLPGHAADIGDHVLELEVHQRQGALDLLEGDAGLVDARLAVAQAGPQRLHLGRRDKGAIQ